MPNFMNEINKYNTWNSALYEHFFSNGNKNPVLSIDENIIDMIGQKNKIVASDYDYKKDFLESTLLCKTKIGNFMSGWRTYTCSSMKNHQKIDRWDNLVCFLVGETLNQKPAYFAMLCAILYCAYKSNQITHQNIKNFACQYTQDQILNFGELVDNLMQQLHKDVKCFDSDRSIGKLRHIGKIKYHLVLKPEDRADFIDIVELYDLKWEYEHFNDYLNNRLFPILSRLRKQNLIDKINNVENYPYFKNILQNKNLNYGKSKSTSNYVSPEIDILWKYEINIIDGQPKVYIVADYLPFCIRLNIENNNFEEAKDFYGASDIVAEDVQIKNYNECTFNINNIKYNFKNICQSNISEEIYLEKLSDYVYRQVDTCEKGKRYILLSSKIKKFNCFDVFSFNGYYTYEYFCKNNQRSINRFRLDDKFELYGVGSWFSIKLDKNENQNIFFKKNISNPSYELLNTCQSNGKHYFRLPYSSDKQISGCLIVALTNDVTQVEDHKILSENICIDIKWNGENKRYEMNGWGEVDNSTSQNVNNIQQVNTARKTIGGVLDMPTQGTDMLLQILYELADENGCVKGKQLVAAIDFVLTYFSVPATQIEEKSIIYALRHLGYIVAYYNTSKRTYENQLIPFYIEKTNFSVDGGLTSAYLLKGVYDTAQMKHFKNTKYKRPYANNNTHKEYCCLPDLILLSTSYLDPNINCIDHPIGWDILSSMKGMNDFCNYFGINSNGVEYLTTTQLKCPCIVKDKYGQECLCTKDSSGYYFTHTSYQSNNGNVLPIPLSLSKIYCLNSNNKPIVVMKMKSNMLDYNRIYFIKNEMPISEVLSIALCDLNLGLPSIDKVNINGTDETCYEFITGATTNNHNDLETALKKISSRSNFDFNKNNSSLLIV